MDAGEDQDEDVPEKMEVSETSSVPDEQLHPTDPYDSDLAQTVWQVMDFEQTVWQVQQLFVLLILAK